MSAENTVPVEPFFTIEAIAFYIWVIGMPIVCMWKQIDSGDYFKLCLEFFCNMIVSIVIAVAIINWFGPKGLIVITFIFTFGLISDAITKLKTLLKTLRRDSDAQDTGSANHKL